MSSARYTDTNSLANSIGDFVVRRRIPTPLQIALIFAATFLITIGLSATGMGTLALGTVMVILFSAVCSYLAIHIQRSRDLVLTTEFQNALFASALGINNKFCLIIRQDGTIVYLNRSFQDMFPDFTKQSRRTVGMLLNYGKLSPDDNKKVFTAIERNAYDKVIFSLQDSQGIFHKIVMSIEPILRPSGFILLRGREFVDERSVAKTSETASPSPFNKSTITLFSHVMDTMDMGVYMTDPMGSFIYTNPIFEHWLGFREGEIASSNLSLKDVVHHTDNGGNSLSPHNYKGTVTLQKKTGGLIECFINQKTILNEEDKTIGCTALVHNITEQKTHEKKKVW